jgi:amino acid transporter
VAFEQRHISLPWAIILNLNVMIGSGIFVNTVLLGKNLGALGAIAYILVGIALLPLVFGFMVLMDRLKGGTFYDYGALINSFTGFIGSWSYFVAKLASCAVSIYVFTALFQKLFVSLQTVPAFWIESIILLAFVGLNMLNMRIGRSIQFGFMVLKSLPIFFAIGVGLWMLNPTYITLSGAVWGSVFSNVPLVLYAFTGFELICSLTGSLKDPQRDGPRAILYAYLIGVAIVVIYQWAFYGALGPGLAGLEDIKEMFPLLVAKLSMSASLSTTLLSAIHTGIATSALGAAYGIMYSNGWNLHALARQKQVIFSELVEQKNKYGVPMICVFVEGAIVFGYLLVLAWYSSLLPLQQIVSCGMTLTYLVSMLALGFIWLQDKKDQNKGEPGYQSLPKTRFFGLRVLLALASCCLFIGALVSNWLTFGVVPATLFGVLLILGLFMFWVQRKNK